MTALRLRPALRIALLALACLGAPARAQTPPAPAPAPEAPAALQQDLYQDALQSISEGRKNDASETLQRLIEKEPLHAGAWMEIALIQCSLGHADEAERMFAVIETRFNPSRGILDLIVEARETGCTHWQAVSSGALTLGRGIDQNVNQGASNQNYVIMQDGIPTTLPVLADFLPKHDQYSVLSGEYTREVTSNGSIGFAQFQARNNDHLHQYDSASLYVGVETPYRFGKWTLSTTAMLGAVSLGGQFYERQAQLLARVSPPLPLPRSLQFNVMGGLTHTQYLTLTNFNSTTAELRGQFTWRDDNFYASASAGYLDDRAGEARVGGALGAGATGELAYTRQTWNSAQAYSPGLIDQVRSQATQVLRATLIYPVGRRESVQLEARVVRDRENISVFQYNNRQLQLSWQWQWP
jgi:hypothetical protein